MAASDMSETPVKPERQWPLGWFLRVSVSLAILAVLFWILPWQDVVEGFSRVSLGVFMSVLVLFMIGHMITALKWRSLIGRELSPLLAIRAHFSGLAANLCLPGVAGGDVVRAGLVAHEVELSKLTAASLSDRLIDMIALVAVSVVGLFMLQTGGSGATLVAQLGALLTLIFVCAFYLFPAIAPRLIAVWPKIPAKGLITKISDEFGSLGKRPILLLLVFAVSFAVQLGFVFLFILFAREIGVNAPDGAWVFAWPIAKVLAVLPISLGGIGVREAGLAGLLAPMGIAATGVVVTSLVWQSVLIVTGLIGALVWFLTGRVGKVSQPTVGE